MRRSRISRRAARFLSEIGATAPLDLEQLCAGLRRVRGRPVHLVGQAFPHPDMFGLWLETADADLILYERNTTAGHQRHIVLHEVGHILLGHGDGGPGRDDAWEALVPDLPAAMVQTVLRRSSYDSAREYEAELFASIVSDWSESLSATADGADGGNGLREALSHPRGWR